MNYKNSTVRKVLLGATLFSILTTSLPNCVIAADTYATNNVESTSNVDKDENQWEADDFTYRKYEEPTYSSGNYVDYGVSVTGFSEKGFKKLDKNKDLVIPEFSTEGDKVKGIGFSAFTSRNLLSVSMPNSIEYIDGNAFANISGSDGLKEVVLSKNIRFIGSSSFSGNNLNKINLTNNIEVIGSGAFYNNKIEKLILPNSIKELNEAAFSDNRITELHLSDNLELIKQNTFFNNRLKSINLPKNLKAIERNAFSNNKIETLFLPNSLVYLGGFSNNRIKDIKIPESVERIDDLAFSGNYITNLKIPKNVKSIGKESFSFNEISDLDLSENINSIGEKAFNANRINSISIPRSIKFIGESAFDNNKIESFKNFPENLIISDDENETYRTGYAKQRIFINSINGNFNLNLEDTEKSYEINDPSITKKSDGTYSLKKDPKFNYRRLFLKVNPYWEIEINNIINFNISYDPNGGVGKITNETIEIDDFYNLKLPENKFTAPQGKKFIGWKPLVEYHSDYNAREDELIQRNRLYLPGSRATSAINGNLINIKGIKFIAQWEDINKDTNPPRRPDYNRPNIQDVNLNNTKEYIKRLLRNEGILTSFKSNQIDKAQTVDELIYLNNLYLKDKFNNNKSTQTVVEKHYIEKPVYIYNNETRYIDRNTKSHIASYVPKYISNDFTKSDEKQNDVKDSKVQKNNNTSKYFKFLIGMNLYYKNIDGKDELFEMDVAPFIENDRTMMPLRYVAEALSCDVKWDNKTRTASFTKDGVTASIQIDGDEIVLSSGEKVKMDSNPIIKNDRLCVSLTNVAKVFNLTNGNTKDKIDQDIEWDQESKTVTINLD
ncbi:hypothetical protein HMPREF3023_00985 [Peptoniphilus sp. HMSC075B08]|uniref:leucine-rich repeat protein n=1 Tax=Peptoniphilus sp. HMSC075B08 TaxID=1739525 RepID=UPI0008A38621|nr:leucine-rich repeat protein [Peptoniphilus sp. HMSC075B08]OFO59802.1 hypothetical protein HMPREF3023_00985 [Peptoniphilus sp. HMSC075B08]